MSVKNTAPGRSVESVLEDGAHTLETRAWLLGELNNAAYAVAETFPADGPAAEVVSLARRLEWLIDRISLTEDGEITLDRRCGCCGGDGTDHRGEQDACEECVGTGLDPEIQDELAHG